MGQCTTRVLPAAAAAAAPMGSKGEMRWPHSVDVDGDTSLLRRLRDVLVLMAALCTASSASPQTAPAPFGEVAHHVVRVDGLRFHYVIAGLGEPVVLLPGWPQSWIAWRKVIPLLVKAGRQVYVLDPRGFGDSDKPQGGYDLDTAARDLHGFLAVTGLSRPGGIDIVAHDVGTWIAHAHAA